MLLHLLLVEEVSDPVFSSKGLPCNQSLQIFFLIDPYFYDNLFSNNKQFANPIRLVFLPLF